MFSRRTLKFHSVYTLGCEWGVSVHTEYKATSPSEQRSLFSMAPPRASLSFSHDFLAGAAQQLCPWRCSSRTLGSSLLSSSPSLFLFFIWLLCKTFFLSRTKFICSLRSYCLQAEFWLVLLQRASTERNHCFFSALSARVGSSPIDFGKLFDISRSQRWALNNQALFLLLTNCSC